MSTYCFSVFANIVELTLKALSFLRLPNFIYSYYVTGLSNFNGKQIEEIRKKTDIKTSITSVRMSSIFSSKEVDQFL